MLVPPTGSSISLHALRSSAPLSSHVGRVPVAAAPCHLSGVCNRVFEFSSQSADGRAPAASRCCEPRAPLITARRLRALCSGFGRILPGGPAAQGTVQRAWINRRYTAGTKHRSLRRGGTWGIRAAGRQALCAPLNELENTIGFPGCENRFKDRGVTWLLGDPGIDLLCPQGPSISLLGRRPGFASCRKPPSRQV